MADYEAFKERIADMDKRLSQIVCHAFDDCSCCESIFKLLEMMGPLLERPIIHEDFKHKYSILLSMYNQDLDQAKVIFDEQMKAAQLSSGPVINKNMPPVAGVLKWALELRERIGWSMEKLRAINHGYNNYSCNTTSCRTNCTVIICIIYAEQWKQQKPCWCSISMTRWWN